MSDFLAELVRSIYLAVGGTFVLLAGLAGMYQNARALITGDGSRLELLEEPVTEPYQMLIGLLFCTAVAAVGFICVRVPINRLLGRGDY